MEFLRFGSSIPGSYWGCCAMDIIQNMNPDPKEKQAIGLINGDSGHPLTKGSEQLYLGITYEEIFRARMVIDSMSTGQHPDHAFLCTMTQSQLSYGNGKKWLAILAEEGFEFLGMVDNSVYSGSGIIHKPEQETVSSHENYLFGCFRNIGSGGVANVRKAPAAWTALDTVDAPTFTAERMAEINKAQREWHLKRWAENTAKLKFYTLKELYSLGLTDDNIREPGTQMKGVLPKVPVYQEVRSQRLLKLPKAVKKNDPFAASKATCSVDDEGEEVYNEDEGVETYSDAAVA